jgi:Mg-chelatase subunit ChlD
MQILTIAQGDLLPTRTNGERWDVITDPEFYTDRLAHDETTWGGLAAFPGKDSVVTSALAPVTINSGGALWYDNVTGLLDRRESVYLTFVGGIMLPTFAKGQGLGDMEALCPPQTVPSPTPTGTSTATPTETPTPTLTPTVTPTRVPGPVYLPVIVREACADRIQRADVVVVLDMSTSMSRPTGSGRQKLLAAQEAVRAFLDRMVLQPGPSGFDQVAVLGFNREAWLQQGLTHDRAALERAIAELPRRQVEGTRIDLAVEAGLAALLAPERDPAHTPVMILLTDGLPQMVPTPVPSGTKADTVLAAARRAKAAGVRLYTVGLGQATDIDARLLTEMASRPDMYYYAPDAEDLAQIYAEIAYTIACPRGRHDWSRPWP